MIARTRLLSAAAVVALVAVGGAAYVNRASASMNAPSIVIGDGQSIAGVDLSSFLSAKDPQGQMIALAYERVERAYYKPVADEMLVDGEQQALTKFLKERKVATPNVPHRVATGNRSYDLSILESTLSSVQKRYPAVASRDLFAQVAVTGMLGGLGDPYTTYLSPQEINGLDEQLHGGDFAGIGVYIVQDKKSGAILVDPIDGNPAVKAGVRPGDSIIAVDGRSTFGQKIDAVEREIRGPSGTVVTLTLRRPHVSEPKTLQVVRAQIHVPRSRTASNTCGSPTSGPTRRRKCATHSSTASATTSKATFSTCATTAAGCSTRRSTSRACSSRKARSSP